VIDLSVLASNFGGSDSAVIRLTITPNPFAPVVTLPGQLPATTTKIKGQDYYVLAGTLAAAGSAKLNTSTFTTAVTVVGTSTSLPGHNIDTSWKNQSGTSDSSATFSINIPKATSGGFTVKVTITDTAGVQGFASFTY
jgi:hypothetical protein